MHLLKNRLDVDGDDYDTKVQFHRHSAQISVCVLIYASQSLDAVGVCVRVHVLSLNMNPDSTYASSSVPNDHPHLLQAVALIQTFWF